MCTTVQLEHVDMTYVGSLCLKRETRSLLEYFPSIKMEKVLHKCLINYYLHLKIVDNTWDETCNSVKELIRGLKNRSQQLRLVTR